MRIFSSGVPKKLITVSAALAVGAAAFNLARPTANRAGCDRYLPIAERTLVAHAGGGLPDRTYSNSRRAFDLAYKNGFRLIEVDLWEFPFGIVRVGHDLLDTLDPRAMTLGELSAWLQEHPDAAIVTDFKTDNISGLTALRGSTSSLTRQIIPQIYQPGEFAPVERLGFRKPIFTLYRNEDPDWAKFANEADLYAVTIPKEAASWAKQVRKPVFLHTVDDPSFAYPSYGLYTDCLVPARSV